MIKKHPKIVLLLMIAVLVGPILFAWMLIQKGERHQLRTSNHGDLIPSMPNITNTHFLNVQTKETITGKNMRGKWWLLYVGPQKCYSECHNIIYNMRQIRVALGKNAPQLDRAFINDPACATDRCEQYINTHYPDMLNAKIEKRDFHKLFTPISNPIDREMIGELYIIDPKGNIMMRYAAEVEARDVLSDLKRLLRVSKKG
jgi:cytochrome oxidase Cu insertion factor (SCO1/SenC/PrrC family)